LVQQIALLVIVRQPVKFSRNFIEESYALTSGCVVIKVPHTFMLPARGNLLVLTLTNLSGTDVFLILYPKNSISFLAI